jgi:uncharacterized protein YabE (DUF348 family)
MSIVKTIVLSIVGVMTVGATPLAVDAVFGRDVTLVVDGQASQVRITYASVAEVLVSQNIELSLRDKVTPDLATVVGDDTVIEVEYARAVDLTLNGDHGVYWTYSTTVGSVLSDLGLGEAALKLSTPQDTAVPRQGLSLSIETGHNVSVTSEGQTQAIHSFGEVGDALTDLGLTWDADDLVTPTPATELDDDMDITMVKVDEQVVTRDEPIPYATENSSDPDAPRGKVTVVTAGVPGVMQSTVKQVLHDGQVVSEEVTAQTVVSQPVTEVTTTGTKADAPAVTVKPGTSQAIAHDLVLARGWDESEFECLVALWNRESGWRVNAANSSSGAYGIPQALPGSKMASAGADWKTNPATQITWGLGYIAGRYGTPCGAWSSFLAQGWY